jgi:hypothetical protein
MQGMPEKLMNRRDAEAQRKHIILEALILKETFFPSAPQRDVHGCTNVAGVRIHKSDLCGKMLF